MSRIGRNPAAGPAFAAIVLAIFWAAAAACAQGQAASPAAVPAASAVPASSGQPVILDRVVAVINDDVILESDIQEELRFTDLQGSRLEPGTNAGQAALERLIDRYLILQQIKATQAQIARPTPDEVQQQVDNLRRQIPQCAGQCQTDAGWRAFLKTRGLTEEEVADHWRERILILAFIQSRFGAGIRISQAEIEDYYKTNLAAEFAARKLSPPPLASVSSRIQEILLQQHVNTFLQEWLQGLKQEGSVSILDDASSVAGMETAPANGTPGGRP